MRTALGTGQTLIVETITVQSMVIIIGTKVFRSTVELVIGLLKIGEQIGWFT